MKNWHCRKTIEMDEDLKNLIDQSIPYGIQAKVLGCILRRFFDSLTPETRISTMVELLTRAMAEGQDGTTKEPEA